MKGKIFLLFAIILPFGNIIAQNGDNFVDTKSIGTSNTVQILTNTFVDDVLKESENNWYELNFELNSDAITDVSFDYSFAFLGSDVEIPANMAGLSFADAEDLDFDDKTHPMPLYSKNETGHIVIVKDTHNPTPATMPYIKVKLDGEIENDEYMLLKITNLNGASLSDGSLDGCILIKLIDGNNKPPYFVDVDKINLTVPENRPKAKAGTIKAEDKEGDSYTFEITGGNACNLFDIGLTSGVVALKNGIEPFDYEEWKQSNTRYTIKVEVCDSRATSFNTQLCTQATFTVKVGDANETPYFTNTVNEIHIAEGAPFSSDEVVSDDYDKKEITQNQNFLKNEYEIIGGDKEFFGITSDGLIYPKNGIELDYEVRQEYEIEVRVRDANKDGDGNYIYPDLYEDKTFKVVVTDVDDAPKFESSIYNGTVDENSVKDTKVIFNPVIKATTSQKGAVITYSLVDETNSFVINPTTGVISVAEGAVLDYETKNTYNLKVVASDESGVAGQTVQTATTSVVIKLIDLNEKPIFVEPATPLEFDEHVKDAIVGTLTYDDLDTASMFRNDKYECTDCDDKGFDIDEDTGVLKTTRAFDYETEEHTYELNIVIYDASDKNLTATGRVTVTLRDVNEPPFLKETVFSVLESDPVGTVLNKNVEGVDIDGPDISFNYFIMNGENEGQETNEFHLDPKTGKITVLSKLDYEMASSYSFKVRVRDEHDSYSDTTVTINVVDVNEAPHFTNKTAVIEIPENASFSSNKVIYEDTDKYNDFVKNELVILEGKDSEFFDITSDGVIKPKNGVVLDYEVKQEYEIDVRVRDANMDADCNYIYPDLYEDKTFKVVVTEAEEPDPTLISAETADNLKVWTARRTVYIQSAVGTEYRIVALDGRPIVASATKTAKDEILLPEAGCYVVQINNKSYKIIVY